MERSFQSMDFRVVLVGIDGPEPSSQILLNCQNAVKSEIRDNLDRELNSDDLYLSVQSGEPTDLQRKKIGSDSTIHVQQYDIGLGKDTDRSLAFFERVIIGKLETMGFNLTGVVSEEPDRRSID